MRFFLLLASIALLPVASYAGTVHQSCALVIRDVMSKTLQSRNNLSEDQIIIRRVDNVLRTSTRTSTSRYEVYHLYVDLASEARQLVVTIDAPSCEQPNILTLP